MQHTTVKQLHDLGQSVWLDALDRKMIHSGELKARIENEGIRGVTSNPSIFEKAIVESTDYAADIKKYAATGVDDESIFISLAVEDIRDAAGLFAPLYKAENGADGYVSLEVSPRLARQKDASIAQAESLWQAVNRPNVMIKIPGTQECLPAIRECTRQGLNINITLLFGLERYRAVADAYLSGLEDRLKDQKSIEKIASVASFFLSRIDVITDPLLEEKGQPELKGETAIACAKEAYQIYREIFGGERFARLKSRGAKTQRLLWASTGTKDPAYSDVKYVEPLIGPDTINTMPIKTLKAYLDHGHPESRLEEAPEKSAALLEQLKKAGIDLDEITDRLETEGIEKFCKPYDKLLQAIAERRTG
ncbi:transaldolase [Compostibacter hankyongensis]|uniref:Transaldolase n=1 Tax=Compostibacter hankyongensis TaxID=1007089 RepID=A0ABP8FI44_9BACT